MFARLRRVTQALMMLPSMLVADQDVDFSMKPELNRLLLDSSTWSRVAGMNDILEPICLCIGFLEDDASTLSDIVAAFAYIRWHIEFGISDACKASFSISAADTNILLQKLNRRFGRIYSPVFALAFRLDPLYDDMRLRVTEKFGASFFDFGKGPFINQCHDALNLLAKSNTDVYQAMVQEFAAYIRRPPGVVDTVRALKAMHPMHIWGHVHDGRTEYPHIAEKASKVLYADMHVLWFSCPVPVCSFSHAQLVRQEESATIRL